jgi:hypothetical protein
MITQKNAAHTRAGLGTVASNAAIAASPNPDLRRSDGAREERAATAFLVYHGQSLDWIFGGDPIDMIRATAARKFMPPRQKPQRGRVDEPVGVLASDHDHANAEFEPWVWDETKGPFRPGPSGAFMNSLGLAARLAYTVMYRSKPELVDGARDMRIESAGELMQFLQHADDDLRQLASVISAAMFRLVSSHAVVALEEEGQAATSAAGCESNRMKA